MGMKSGSFNRRGPSWPKWLLGCLCLIGVVGLLVVGWRSGTRKGVVAPDPMPVVSQEAPPLLAFASRGMVVTPLQRDQSSDYANVVVSHLPQKTTQLVFDGDVSISSLALFTYQEEPFLEVIVADEDSNGDGKINAQDIHQVVWVSLDRMDQVKVEYPRMHVRKYVGQGRMLLSDAEKRDYARVYQVAVDTNQNGQMDAADPTQWVAISLADRDVHAFLPSPDIPGQSVVTPSAQVAPMVKNKTDQQKGHSRRSSRTRSNPTQSGSPEGGSGSPRSKE